ncbi:unnamed protein product [Spirodela intermedia]|uniref:VQ domain-containing protein n=1 Tax=Spirodela intermedia TaxID=51605 RepID=A0A7I8L5P0_SPIIN|nr:unnamed protein product [Spirodela intermedia]
MKVSPELKAAPTTREVNLKGPRPSPLKVSKDFHKIKKAACATPAPPAASQPSDPPAAPPPPREPVIIYAVSPKVFYAEPGDFMTLVQRLTGPSPSAPAVPEATAAAEERGWDPSGGAAGEVFDLLDILREEAAEGTFPGILSPLPTALPSIATGFFSRPAAEPTSPASFLSLKPTLPSLSLSPGAFWDAFGRL